MKYRFTANKMNTTNKFDPFQIRNELIRSIGTQEERGFQSTTARPSSLQNRCSQRPPPPRRPQTYCFPRRVVAFHLPILSTDRFHTGPGRIFVASAGLKSIRIHNTVHYTLIREALDDGGHRWDPFPVHRLIFCELPFNSVEGIFVRLRNVQGLVPLDLDGGVGVVIERVSDQGESPRLFRALMR